MKILLENSNICIDDNEILLNVSLEIEEKGFYRISGKNGGGKSILLNSLLGFYQVEEGKRISEFNKDEIVYIPDKPFFFDDEKVKEVIDVTSFFYSIKLDKIIKILNNLQFDYDSNKNKKIYELSKGMQQKLLLIPLFIENKYYFLDEILVSLDDEITDLVLNRIVDILKKDRLVVMIEHNQASIDFIYSLINNKTNCKEITCQEKKVIVR